MDKQQAIEGMYKAYSNARTEVILHEQQTREVSDLIKRCRAETEYKRSKRDADDFTVTMVMETKNVVG